MDHEQLFAEFNVSAARNLSLSSEVRMRAEYNILEKKKWKSLAKEKNNLLQVKDKEIEDSHGEATRSHHPLGSVVLTSIGVWCVADVFQVVAATEGNPAVPQHTTIETGLNMTLENKEHFQTKKEAIFLLLTGIRDEIYSIVDACNMTNEMWITIERLQQGESLNVQDIMTNWRVNGVLLLLVLQTDE
ncbi:hypothetical protein Tco_0332054 [Tanacetum coccineum]